MSESEEIEFEAVKREEQFINIKKYKNENEISGTEITLILKKDLLDNIDVVNHRSKIVKDQFWIINDLFGKNKFYGSLWYGYPDEYDKICKTIPEIVEIKEEISSEKLMLSNLDRIKEIVKKMEENTISTDKNQLEEELKKVCKKALVNIEKIEHKTAYSVTDIMSCRYIARS